MLKREVKFFKAISEVLKLLKSKINLGKYLAINKSHFFHPESSRLWTEHQFRLKGNKYFRRGYQILSYCFFLSQTSGWGDGSKRHLQGNTVKKPFGRSIVGTMCLRASFWEELFQSFPNSMLKLKVTTGIFVWVRL